MTPRHLPALRTECWSCRWQQWGRWETRLGTAPPQAAGDVPADAPTPTPTEGRSGCSGSSGQRLGADGPGGGKEDSTHPALQATQRLTPLPEPCDPPPPVSPTCTAPLRQSRPPEVVSGEAVWTARWGPRGQVSPHMGQHEEG